jgi:hypothetical protein
MINKMNTGIIYHSTHVQRTTVYTLCSTLYAGHEEEVSCMRARAATIRQEAILIKSGHVHPPAGTILYMTTRNEASSKHIWSN